MGRDDLRSEIEASLDTLSPVELVEEYRKALNRLAGVDRERALAYARSSVLNIRLYARDVALFEKRATSRPAT